MPWDFILSGVAATASNISEYTIENVQKAFHQVEVCEGDRDFLRFLWVEDLTDEQLKIKELHFTKVKDLTDEQLKIKELHFTRVEDLADEQLKIKGLHFTRVEDLTDDQLKIKEHFILQGSASSPFLLNGTFQKYFENYQKVNPLFVK